MPTVTYRKEMAGDVYFSRFIKANAQQKVNGIRNLGEQMGMSPNTIYVKVNNPSKLTLEDLRRIRRVCGIDKKVFAEELEKIL